MKQRQRVKNTGVSAYELMSMGSVSGMIDIEDLHTYAQEEVFEFAQELDPVKEDEILTRIFRLKEIRSKLLSYRALDADASQPAVVRKGIQKNIERLEGDLQELITELNADATPENKDTYTKYLRVLIESETVYRSAVQPLKQARSEREAERNVLTHQIGRSEDEQVLALEDLRDEADAEVGKIDEQLDEYIGSEGYRELYAIDRLDYMMNIREQLNSGKFVELEGMREEIEFIKHALRVNEPVMLVGDLGSGKTEALRHAAKQHLIEKGKIASEEYDQKSILVFSGSKESSIYDLMGKMKIKREDLTLEDRVDMLKKEMQKMGAKTEEWTVEGREKLLQTAVQAYDAGWTYSQFAYGVMAQAIRDGEPIIIDEIDQIPPEILARINDLMTKKPGEKWRIQENGEEEITIPEGFIVLATANLKSGRYKSREELDAAFASRFIVREHDYLSLEDSYDLILGYFADLETASLRQGIPPEALEQFPSLAVAMKEIQEIFQGKFKTSSLLEAGGTGATRHMELQKSTFSTRTLTKALDFWVKTGMKKISLDEALGTVLLSPVNKNDQMYLLDIMLRFGFFRDWKSSDFKKKLSIAIEQDKLDTLQGALTTDVVKEAQGKFIDVLNQAQAHMQATARMMGYVGGEEKIKDQR